MSESSEHNDPAIVAVEAPLTVSEPPAESPAHEPADGVAGARDATEDPAPPDGHVEAEGATAPGHATVEGQPQPESQAHDTAAPTAEAAKAPPRNPQAASLYRSFRSGRPIKGRIEQVIKGGYEVKIGKARGFCPQSQMDVARIEDPEALVGRTESFRITQVRRGGADVVLSRRALIEDARKEEAAAVRATLIEGSVMLGHVASIADFGVFVDLGAGVQGLVHVSEVSHERIQNPGEGLQPGATVNVKILKLDEARGRISLSIRRAVPDPWDGCAEKFPAGTRCQGKLCRFADFGAFVEVAPGVEALAPASEFPPSRLGWQSGLEVGAMRDWTVLSVDPHRRRIALAPVLEGFDPAALPPLEPGAHVSGRIQRIERFGVFVWLGPGRVGLMPSALTGTPPGTDLSRRFPVGDDLEVEVVEVADDGRRIRLSAKGARATEERPRQRRDGNGDRPHAGVERPRDGARARAPRQETRPEPRQAPPPADAGSTFGTSLADKLRAALDRTGGA